MKVAVCDDNCIFLEEMADILLKSKYVKQTATFSSPLELVMQINKESDYDIVFMDLDWKSEEKTGFQWAEEIYQMRSNIPIIFITGYNDRFAQQVLLANVNVLGYMTKPVDLNILERYLKKAIEQKAEVKYLILSRQSGKISLNQNEIIHIESHNHKAIVCTDTEQYIVYEKLGDLNKRLSKDFVQCHKSFVVNLNWVKKLEGKTLTLRNEREIPISRSFSTNVRDAFFRYLGNEI